ncbi:unnamed protein product [Brassica oleracea]
METLYASSQAPWRRRPGRRRATMKVAGCNDEYASSLKLDSQIPQRRKRIKADVKSIEETTKKVVVGLVRTGR